MKNDRVLSLIGLAERSRNVVSGEFSADKAIKDGTAKLVIVGVDSSGNTKKAFSNSCFFYKVPYYEYSTKEELGHGMGKELRAVLAITDEGFARFIKKLLDERIEE